MSEYQYYEFIAIDRPLDGREQAEVRSLSTRARITATSFANEYHWGDFSGDPHVLMDRYYDAHLYVANWGTRQVMFRLPVDQLDVDAAEQYCLDDQVVARAGVESLVLAFTSDDDGDFELVDDPETMLPTIVGVRAELANGDLRSLYLAWLAACAARARDGDVPDRDADDDLEPPVPSGLNALSAAQQALADFLRLDDVLVEVAARTSAPLEEITDGTDAATTWMARLPVAEKDELLARVIQGDAVRVRSELLRHRRGDTPPSSPSPPRRPVASLLDDAAHLQVERQRQAAVQRIEGEVRREAARAVARERRLDELAHEGDAVWSRVEAMIATRKPGEYDSAVALLTELQALAERDDHFDAFTLRTMAIRQTHARKPSFIERLDKARL